MRLHLKIINDELARLGCKAQLSKANRSYYTFDSGEAANWVDRTVKVHTINSLTLKQWIGEYRRLKELNERILRTLGPGHTPPPAG